MNIVNGDCLEVMKTYPNNHFSAIVSDPPYGLSFMGKDWDRGIPGEAYWKEALRICKPGSHLLAFGGTRTFHRLACAIEDAGWEIRDCISWLYGSGFPKSHNHFGIPGYGTALKPAWEPIIMAMKPCEGTFAQNAEKWGQTGININGCRIGTTRNVPASPSSQRTVNAYGQFGEDQDWNMNHGRWPANLILDEVAAEMLDQQTSELGKSAGTKGDKSKNKVLIGGWKTPDLGISIGFGDSGGASRFFYVAKASTAERNRGCEKNSHPTVKPIKLMEYLIKLIAPPKDSLLLDPFAGSGTTLLAAQNLGIKCVGIEMSADYCEIAKARIHGNTILFTPKLVESSTDCVDRNQATQVL